MLAMMFIVFLASHFFYSTRILPHFKLIIYQPHHVQPQTFVERSFYTTRPFQTQTETQRIPHLHPPLQPHPWLRNLWLHPPSAPVIFLFHGMPGSRICGRSWSTLCARLNARLIAIDRPGCGLSTFCARTMTDWPDDVLALADHLGIHEFSVLGASGGAGFALACARFIPPERLRGTMVVCGIAPLDAFLDTMPYFSWRVFGLTKWIVGIVARNVVLPAIMRPYLNKDAAQLKQVIEEQCKTPEEEALLEDTTGETNVDDSVVQFLEAFRQGDVGCRHDGGLLTRDWGFDLADVDSMRVWLVHGDQDATAPLATARWMDEKLGVGRLRVLEGKTHFTIWKEHEEEIFQQLADM
jgi:pimeloyl-ACP methyl ester carboxylesterase